jgi:signal transduction histidine kinase
MGDLPVSDTKTSSEYEAELRAASEAVYKHSLELATLTKELEELNKKQETLIHFISHEVKGFLTKDQATFAALLEGDFGALPDDLRPLVTEALAQVRTGVGSVMNILQASNQKKGTATYQKEPFDLKALIIESTERARSGAEGKKLSLTLHTGGTEQYSFTGDKEQLAEHVLRNLIDNAVTYTPSGSIDVTLEKKGDIYSLSVKDTGVGISAEDKAHLFTEGGHGKESQKVNVHSTGYGLFIAKNVVEAHGGTIRAESDGPGKGSTFIVELPASLG